MHGPVNKCCWTPTVFLSLCWPQGRGRSMPPGLCPSGWGSRVLCRAQVPRDKYQGISVGALSWAASWACLWARSNNTKVSQPSFEKVACCLGRGLQLELGWPPEWYSQKGSRLLFEARWDLVVAQRTPVLDGSPRWNWKLGQTHRTGCGLSIWPQVGNSGRSILSHSEVASGQTSSWYSFKGKN